MGDAANQGTEEQKQFVHISYYRGFDKKVRAKTAVDPSLGFEARYHCKASRKRCKKELSVDELDGVLRLVLRDGLT